MMSLWRSCEQSFLDNAIFLKVTIPEKKIGFLLIQIYRKLVNTQNYGHQGSILGALLLRSAGLIPRRLRRFKIKIMEEYPAFAKRKSSLGEMACHGELYLPVYAETNGGGCLLK